MNNHKPAILYHASSNRNVEIFEPRAESVRDQNEGPVVFATPQKEIATQYIVPTTDDWANGGAFRSARNDRSPFYFFAISDKERFRELDKGGAIYELPPDSFECDSTRGMHYDEWVSKSPVKPIRKQEFESGLEAMLDIGVQVYFLSKADYEEYMTAPGEDKIKPFLRNQSENQKRNYNARSLPA